MTRPIEGGCHLVLLGLFRVFTISKTPRIHLGIAALSAIKRPFPFHLYCQILLSLQTRAFETNLCTTAAFHEVILKASESLLILEVSSEQTLFWPLSMALSPIVWLRNLCHSSIWVGSYLDANMIVTTQSMLVHPSAIISWMMIGSMPSCFTKLVVVELCKDFQLCFFQISLTFFMKLLLRIKLLGDPLRGVIGGGLSSSRSPGMKFSSLSESLVQNMSTLVETLRWLLKLTFLISFRISVKSLMSRWCDIMTRMSQSPKPRLNLVSRVTLIKDVWGP